MLTEKPTNRPTDEHGVIIGSYTSNNSAVIIILILTLKERERESHISKTTITSIVQVDNPIEKIADLALDMMDATKQVLRDPSDPKKPVRSKVVDNTFEYEASL